MLLITALLSVLLTVSATANGIKSLEPIQRQHNVSAISCVVQLSENYYHSDTKIIGSLLMVHIQNTTPMHNQLMQSLMESNTYTFDLINQYTRCGDECYSSFAIKAKSYFVAFKELAEVTAALRVWRKLPTWNPLARFVAVFLNDYDDAMLQGLIRFVIESFFKIHALNVKVISFRKDSNVIQAHTWYPYEGENCANEVRAIHLIDECYYSDDRIGPQHIRNVTSPQPAIPLDLHGCPLRIATSVYEPYVYYDPVDKEFNRGIEILLIRAIAQALEMTPIFIPINETRENRIVENDTGIYSMLLKRYELIPSRIVTSYNLSLL